MFLWFPPRTSAQDAIAEIHYLTSRSYEWVLEGDIKACFDEISHSALLMRMRARVGDKRVLDLVKAFLKSGILGEDRKLRESNTGASQSGLCSAEHNPRLGYPSEPTKLVGC